MTHETLRMAREKKGWSLEELSRRAGIRLKAAEHIEQGQFAELPAGLYCRSTIRSYASAVGLNPAQVLEALAPLLPAGEDPLDGLARRYGHSRKVEAKPAEPATVAPVEVEATTSSVEFADFVYRAETPHRASSFAPAQAENADVTGEAAAGSNFDRLKPWWRPLTASAIDGALLAAVGGLLVWLTAIACGTSMSNAVRIGAPGIALVFALIVALYFVVFGGIGNATPGMGVMHLEERTQGRTILHARDVFGRACRSIFRDTSMLAE